MDPAFLIFLLLVAAVVAAVWLLGRRRAVTALMFVVAIGLIGFALRLVFMEETLRGGIPLWGVVFILALVGAGYYLMRQAVLRVLLPAPVAATACPPIGRLRDLLAERLRPQDHTRVAAHLDGCTACQHRVEGLTAGREPWTGVARQLAREAPPPAPALREVMDRLKGEKKQDTTRDEPPFADDLPLGFLSPTDKPGQLGRLERYEVLEEVGRGGMGVVLKAFDPTLHRVVAIKVLAPQLATSGVARKRFLREAKAAAAVTHDHIVTIHAVEETNGLPYLVMQYIAGLSLQGRIDRDGPVGDLAEVLRIGAQTAAALAAAHAHGIVHRDVKPGNILLEEGVGRVKITDFGLARAMDDASLTQSGFVAGSPLYMAPEQARGESLDHRADLFSLGSVLYTMATGRPPFRAANTLAVLRRVCEDTPRPVRETNPEVPDWLVAVIDRLMAKEPADRYQSAAEVVEVLERQLAQLQHRPYVPAPKAEPPAGLPTSVTICPSCGAGLHVPEQMVGTTVHCGECGAPFRAEDGSEEIRVARPVAPPFGGRARSRRKVSVWALALLGSVALALLAGLLFTVAEAPPRPAVAHVMGHAEIRPAPPGEPFWNSALAGLPAEATLFGAVDVQALGGLSLDDEWARTLLRLALSAGVEDKLTPENLGRVRLETASVAYYDRPAPDGAEAIVKLDGLALDGRRRVLDFLREATAGKAQVQTRGPRSSQERDLPVSVSGPGMSFALGLVGDRTAVLARHMTGADARHLKALAQLPWFDFLGGRRAGGSVLTGYNPPWLQSALMNIPPDAYTMAVGELPADWRKSLTEALKLQACPRRFVFHLRPDGDALRLRLTLNVDTAGAELALQEDLVRWNQRTAAALEAMDALRQEPWSLTMVREVLKTTQWAADPASRSVWTELRVSRRMADALLMLARRAAQPAEDGPADR